MNNIGFFTFKSNFYFIEKYGFTRRSAAELLAKKNGGIVVTRGGFGRLFVKDLDQSDSGRCCGNKYYGKGGIVFFAKD